MTILGRTGFRPGRDSLRLVQHVEAATATALQIFFNPDEADFYVLHAYDVEKPAVLGQAFQIRISTNGATIETATLGYDWHSAGNASATIWNSIAATGDDGIVLNDPNSSGFATATNWGGGELVAEFWRPTATNRPTVRWQFHFSNSASMPHERQGAGWYATGPIKGISFEGATGGAFSAKADLYAFRADRV